MERNQAKGKAGTALREVLEEYMISQNRLAIASKIARSTVNQWVNSARDPLACSVVRIADALDGIKAGSGSDFLSKFLGRSCGKQKANK